MTLDHLREIALIQISQAQRTNAMNPILDHELSAGMSTALASYARENDNLTAEQHLAKAAELAADNLNAWTHRRGASGVAYNNAKVGWHTAQASALIAVHWRD